MSFFLQDEVLLRAYDVVITLQSAAYLRKREI